MALLFLDFPSKTCFDILVQIVSFEDNLYEMSKPIFWKRIEKTIMTLSSAEF